MRLVTKIVLHMHIQTILLIIQYILLYLARLLFSLILNFCVYFVWHQTSTKACFNFLINLSFFKKSDKLKNLRKGGVYREHKHIRDNRIIQNHRHLWIWSKLELCGFEKISSYGASQTGQENDFGDNVKNLYKVNSFFSKKCLFCRIRRRVFKIKILDTQQHILCSFIHSGFHFLLGGSGGT